MENLFRQEVIEKKKHRLDGTISLVQPPAFKFLTLLILVVVIISLVFLALGSYTRKEKVSGVLQPNSGLSKLSAPQSGIVAELMVDEGQFVEKNQPLLRIISEKHGIEGFELNQSLINQYEFQLTSLKNQLTQQVLQNKLQIQELKNSRTNLDKRLEQISVQSDIFNQRIEINNKIVKQKADLATTGYISELELEMQRDTSLSLKQQLSSIQSEKLSIKNQKELIENQLDQLPLEQKKIKMQLETQIADLKVQLAQVKLQRLGELRSPVDGIVSALLAKQGKEVSANQSLLSILPRNAAMQAVIYVPTSAFGFVKKGQKTRIRYHAFPYEKFGVYEGQIVEVSANVILPTETDTPGIISHPSYRAVIALGSDTIIAYGNEIPLRAGMQLDADIIIEERSLLRWLFDPVFSIAGRI